ncbi:hypothetical protein H2198_001921 [Neophaeococcomyces mojaviensis]|uniref:Uncharacterized protein n=1 Tax=Neophaeococcomyces mojaviensis TaxID=3383035 RepID=A0ACC3AG76_9EURO|nr:hypothetical protein H2198_001921 [Knufia sp. JES_112]
MPEEVMDEEASFIEKDGIVSRPLEHKLLASATVPWVIVVILLAYILMFATLPGFAVLPDTQSWALTDFISARHAIRPTTTQFTSSLEFSDPKRIYRVYDPTAPVYVGNASAEIDQNWDDLILPADIYVTDEEASSLPANTRLYRSPETRRYKIELEVFHSLHCLNMIRMRVYANQYPEMLSENARVHVGKSSLLDLVETKSGIIKDKS